MENLETTNESIEVLFGWYEEERILVNRKYQRKLVWILAEKQKFVDTILHLYPVPLFLLAEKESQTSSHYEIIDGMQRLEAIFSFLTGEYLIDNDKYSGYFDLSVMSGTKKLLDIGKISQKRPVLNAEVCRNFVRYRLPLSITKYEDSQVEEIFRRINSTGRQLSQQDLRQAGALGEFSNLVRKISCQIRRDSSDDVLNLSKMREISLSSYGLQYGIKLKDVFWVKQEIITADNMRLSRDEELVSYLLLYILLGKDIPPSANTLDVIYGLKDDKYLLINKLIQEIEKRSEKNIILQFMHVFDEVDKTLTLSNKTFSELLFNKRAHGKVRSFQVLFLAMYNLLASGKEIADYKQLIKKLDGIGKREFDRISDDIWKAEYRQSKIQAVQGIIQDCFVKSDSSDPAIDNWISKLENILSQSKIEQQLFDFKLGFFDIETNNQNYKCLSKVIKTLTAMVNEGKNKTGYVLVGIADNKSVADIFSKKYSQKTREFNGVYITGTDMEINLLYKSADEFFNKIKQAIEKEPVSENIVSAITRNMRLVNYYDKSVLVLKLGSVGSPVMYDNKYYERRGANLHELAIGEMSDLFERFRY
ncbi:MAG: DUF262 domain-containing protein [Treponema sp.]|nr:DUF262 domain-containing protein [Treponema sp.]